MNLSPKHLIKFLERNGCIFKWSKGSHQLHYNSEAQITVILPFHGGKDLKKGTFLSIVKQAGLDKNEME
jgi:predicted RNA binding protein YcfA (HicA-like mRNA interferase family)